MRIVNLLYSNPAYETNPEFSRAAGTGKLIFKVRIAVGNKYKLPIEYFYDIYLSLNSLNELHL
ncbi:hypothetical protein [Pseudanabaena sp. BC1403]|uniref:hypothetical protein n=1 Tax=Pseudanabaena sp. BC1403 TaxID=2043171 RepID=UPI000CD9B62C|nr:hypothetical protein [Pseudanabaena sp. BC1403]